MGNVAASICSPCGGSKPPPPPKAPAACNVQGYDCCSPEEAAPAPASPAAAPASPVIQVTPAPEEPPKPVPTTPIILETLQGDWVNSMGAKIKVTGTEVSLNGMVMKVHPVTLNEDGTIASIGRIWQMKGWQAEDQIEFKEAPSREVMEFARSVVWTRATEAKMAAWTEQMAGLGYSGSSKDVMSRGIEGCCPGTCDAKASIAVDDADRDKAELQILNKLIQEYRLAGLSIIPARRVIPDFSNRGHTGLSVEHVHYLATSFKEKGFQPRTGDIGHDIPVLVKQEAASELGKKSIENWRSKVKDEPGFPPIEHYESLVFRQDEFYCSLGNGHFNQALNLFYCECPSIYKDAKYTIDDDQALRKAVFQGVPSIVLRSDIALRDRETISRLLNSKREFKWSVGPDGSVDISDSREDTSTCKQFEAMSKVLDAVELNCLVRSELGIKDSHRIGQ